MARSVRRHADIAPSHPGEHLAEIISPSTELPGLGKGRGEIAALLGISRQSLHNLLNGKTGVSAEMALRLGKLLGTGPDIWLRLQNAHDLWHAERALRGDLARMPTLRAA